MLKISKLTDYATIVMSYLAQIGQVCSAQELAASLLLPYPTVSKLLKILAEAKLVQAYRGSDGGYQLVRDAKTITLADLVIAIEGAPAMTTCCGTEQQCERDANCAIQHNWKTINHIIMDVLTKLTLQDMARPLSSATLKLKNIPIVVKDHG